MREPVNSMNFGHFMHFTINCSKTGHKRQNKAHNNKTTKKLINEWFSVFSHQNAKVHQIHLIIRNGTYITKNAGFDCFQVVLNVIP